MKIIRPIQLLLGSAVVSTAVFGVSPKTRAVAESSPNGDGGNILGLAGGTPARATETVALPEQIKKR